MSSVKTATTNCNAPSDSSVHFDADQLGHVTVFNNSTCTNDYTFIVWRVVDNGSHDSSTQVPMAQYGFTLAPGETGHGTVGFAVQCGAAYQRDLYFGVKAQPGDALFTYSDINNLKFYAHGGAYWTESGECQSPIPPAPTVPPVVAPPAPPAPPACASVNPPQFATAHFTRTNPATDLAASATVSNGAAWKLVLYAASDLGDYPDDADYTKDITVMPLACGEVGTLTVSYPWSHHSAKFWWVKLFQDGVEVFVSSKVTK